MPALGLPAASTTFPEIVRGGSGRGTVSTIDPASGVATTFSNGGP